MNKINKKITATIVFIISVIISFYIMIKSNEIQNGFNMIWILPLLYGVSYYFSNMRMAIFDYLGIFILNIVMFFRYAISPLYSTITNLFYHSNALTTSVINNKTALLLMIYELACICFFMHFFIRKLNINKINLEHIISPSHKKPLKESYHIYYIAIIIGVLTFIIFPSVRERANFFIIDEIGTTNLNTLSTFGFLFSINIFKIIFIIVIGTQLFRMNKGKKPNKFLIFTSLILCISFVASTNRSTIIIQSLACLVTLRNINLLNMRTLIVTIFITIIIIISLTTYRQFETGDIVNITLLREDVDKHQFNTDNLQSYLGGPHLIAIAVKDKESFNGNVETFFNEILSSINFIRQIFPLSSGSSTVHFNKNFGFLEQNSMILPSLGQSYYYFGTIGAPILSIFFCFLIFITEKQIIKTNDIGKKFSFYILVSWLGLFLLQNLNIVTASIFNVFLPLYVIVILNSKLRI